MGHQTKRGILNIFLFDGSVDQRQFVPFWIEILASSVVDPNQLCSDLDPV